MMTTHHPMDEIQHHAALRLIAKQAANVERALLGLGAQITRFGEEGWPPAALLWSEEQLPALRRVRDQLMRQLPKAVEGTDLYSWQRATMGLGPALFLVLGHLPVLSRLHSVSAVWKWCGLHVSDGAAPKMKRGETAGFSPRLRSYALMRIADPCVKCRQGPYRRVYDQRRARTAETHPDWTLKHAHMDALRVTAKAVLRDAWRVDRGLPPRYYNAAEPTAIEAGEGAATGATQTAPSNEPLPWELHSSPDLVEV